MRQIIYFFGCVTLFFLLSGFESGIEAERLKNEQVKSSEPILEYEEPLVTHESSQDLYQEYHLLTVTSLEEASITIFEDPTRSYFMAQNAYNYMKLIKKLLFAEHANEVDYLNKKLVSLISKMREPGLSSKELNKLSNDLKQVIKDVKNNFGFTKVQEWIKN